MLFETKIKVYSNLNIIKTEPSTNIIPNLETAFTRAYRNHRSRPISLETRNWPVWPLAFTYVSIPSSNSVRQHRKRPRTKGVDTSCHVSFYSVPTLPCGMQIKCHFCAHHNLHNPWGGIPKWTCFCETYLLKQLVRGFQRKITLILIGICGVFWVETIWQWHLVTILAKCAQKYAIINSFRYRAFETAIQLIEPRPFPIFRHRSVHIADRGGLAGRTGRPEARRHDPGGERNAVHVHQPRGGAQGKFGGLIFLKTLSSPYVFRHSHNHVFTKNHSFLRYWSQF